MSVGSVRLDIRSDVEDLAGFAGQPPNRLFVAVHRPRTLPATATLVVCPPILSDLAVHYRREVLLGRALAALGVAVTRFQYRGTGNSHGDPAETTFETLVEDAHVATAIALELGPRDGLAYLGTRVGALVAAAASRPVGAPLILWEPVTDGASYWREAFRARLIRSVSESGGGHPPVRDAAGQLAAAGWIDLLGYRVTRRLHDSLRDRALAAELGPRPGPVLRLDKRESRGRWWFNPEPSVEEISPAAELISAWLSSVGAP
jgi:hypothetical protein